MACLLFSPRHGVLERIIYQIGMVRKSLLQRSFFMTGPPGLAGRPSRLPYASGSSVRGAKLYPMSSQRVRRSSRMSALVLEVEWSRTMAPS